MQNIGEGNLAIPADWHNASVNIFSASAKGGLALSATRDRRAPGSTLAAYVEQQFAGLSQQLGQFSLLDQGQMMLGEVPAHWLEISWHSEQQGLVHQILMCTEQGGQILNFSGTQTGMMQHDERAQIMTLLASFRFNGSVASQTA